MHLRLILLLLAFLPRVSAGPEDYFTIRVIDDATERGVPMIELRTVNKIRLWTDSAGLIAFHEPGLMNQKVFFHVAGHGYTVPKDGFGYRGQALDVRAGETATLRVQRVNVAERLYRVTGGGIYRDSVLLGRPVPIDAPVLNALVFGQDSVVNAVYHDRICWFYGDTSRPAYPLGIFEVTGATSRLPGQGGLDPAVGVDLDYFTDDTGFARKMAPIPGPGPTWIDGVVTLRDADGAEHLFAVYAKVNQQMKAHGRGLLEFDDEAERFERIAEFDIDAPIHPGGHTIIHRDGPAAPEYVYYTRPFPVVRVPARVDALADLANYACYTCLKPGCDPEKPELDRAADGTLTWKWKHDAPPLLPRVQEQLIQEGRLEPHEARFRLIDIETGDVVIIHGGSVYWNAYRQRWVLIGSQIFGTSMLGEIWYAEADTLLGPWRYARKIVTHERYSFYNPKQHPMFDQDSGRRIYFEGTYTATFSGNDDQTPRYDYNQIMYRLDLADARLVLPVPVYRRAGAAGVGLGASMAAAGGRFDPPAFFALDRPVAGCVAIGRASTADDAAAPAAESAWVARAMADVSPGTPVLFYALPADITSPSANTAVLRRYDRGGEVVYAVDGRDPPAGFTPGAPLCTVWRAAAQRD
jgi:hypothetical protein